MNHRGVLGCLAAAPVVAYALVPGFAAAGNPLLNAYNLTALASCMVLLVAVITAGHVPRWPWLALGGAVLAWTLGDAVYIWLGTDPAVSPADALYVVGYIAFGAALWRFQRSRSHHTDLDTLIDAATIATVALLAVWELVIKPNWASPGVSTAGQLMTAAYPILDVLLLFLLAGLLLSPSDRSVVGVLLALGLSTILVADTSYAILVQTNSYVGGVTHLLDVSWLAGYALLALAALHPSARNLTTDLTDLTDGAAVLPGTAGRLSIPAIALLCIPGTAVATELTGREAGLDAFVLATVTLVPLVMWRIVRLNNQVAAAAELRASTRAAEAASQAKTEFLSRMSHELRTPLNAILGFAQLLQLEPLGDREQESVEFILRGGRHLRELINEVLDMAAIEAGHLQLAPEPVHINELLADAVGYVGPLAADEHIEVHIPPGGDELLVVHADRQRLTQVLLNLLGNAIKYNRPHGSVTVTARPSPHDTVRIDVTDTGPGISPSALDAIFTPFERAGAEDTTIEGTGIGLALSKALTEHMGGRLQVTSVVDHGSTFTIELPASPDPNPAAVTITSAALAASHTDPRRIVVEEGPDGCRQLRS